MERTKPKNYLRNYPRLFHCTHEDSIMTLLKSKSLLARPVWDFEDTREYILGLEIILEELKRLHELPPDSIPVDPSAKSFFETYCGSTLMVLDQVISYIEFEIENYMDPNVRVYVSCFSGLPNGKMLEQYGSAVIQFNPVLPVLAYYCPNPFTGSMISWVAYSQEKFRSSIPEICIDGPMKLLMMNSGHSVIMNSLSTEERLGTIAEYLVEGFCAFAPNIKEPEFAFEREWRLKSLISKFAETNILCKYSQGRKPGEGVPAVSAPTENEPRRYLRELSYQGWFASEHVFLAKDSCSDLAQEIAEWHSVNAMGPVDLDLLISKLEA